MKPCKPIRKADAVRVARKLGVKYSPGLLKGMKIEREHRDVFGCDPVMAARIAIAHLRERRDYYDRIEKYVERRKGLGSVWWVLPLALTIPFVPPL
jgi:hypothetical protein